MVTGRPTIATACVWAYWDFAQALRVLARPALIALAILVAAVVAGFFVPRILTPSPLGRMIVLQAVEVLACRLLTPFVMAIYRYILLGEVAEGYDTGLANPRSRLLFGWLAVVSLLMNIPLFISAAATPTGGMSYAGLRSAEAVPAFLIGGVRAAVFICVPRLIALLPAVAVDAPGAIWQNAFCDTYSRSGYVFAVVLLPPLPVVLFTGGGLWTLQFLTSGAAFFCFSFLLLSASLLTLLTLTAVIAARLYQVLGDQLNQPLPER